jgi:hypothetical protein
VINPLIVSLRFLFVSAAKERRILTICAVINISNDAGYENAVSKTAQ